MWSWSTWAVHSLHVNSYLETRTKRTLFPTSVQVGSDLPFPNIYLHEKQKVKDREMQIKRFHPLETRQRPATEYHWSQSRKGGTPPGLPHVGEDPRPGAVIRSPSRDAPTGSQDEGSRWDLTSRGMWPSQQLG